MAANPQEERFYLFNFFETPSNMEGFRAGWESCAEYIKKQDHFFGARLHKSSDPNALFPIVNFAFTDSADVCCFGKPDEEWRKIIIEKVVGTAKGYPAGFKEVAAYSGPDITKSPERRFFITAIQVGDEELKESDWKQWSGCDVIHDKLKDEAASYLYKSFTTNLSPRFKYVVRSEVFGLSDNDGHAIAKAANESPKTPGVKTFTSFYKIDVSHDHESENEN